jgi:hypothetical protein
MEREHLGGIGRAQRFSLCGGKESLLPPEYAKYKNRPTDFTAAASSLWAGPEVSELFLRLEADK